MMILKRVVELPVVCDNLIDSVNRYDELHKHTLPMTEISNQLDIWPENSMILLMEAPVGN
jgi:hypothetical protein